MYLLYALTLFSGLLVDFDIKIEDENDVFNSIFCALSFFVIYHSFSNYNKVRAVQCAVFNKKDKMVIEIVKYIGIISFVINIYVAIRLFSVFFSGAILIDEFKNGDGGAEGDIVSSFINPGLLTLTRIFSPFAYICMGLHFYYLTQSDKKKTILFFLGALNILLVSLTSLSRSSFMIFAIMYLFSLIFIYPVFNERTKKKVKLSVFIFGGAIVSIFMSLTLNRFENYTTTDSKNIIKDPVANSIVVYASQAHEISLLVLEKYKDSEHISPPQSLALFNYVSERFLGNPRETKSTDDREKKFGIYAAAFTNSPCQLVFDWGYMGTIMILCLFYLFVIKKAPKKGIIIFHNFLWFCPLITFAAMSILTNMLAYTMFHLGVLYILVFNTIVHPRYR